MRGPRGVFLLCAGAGRGNTGVCVTFEAQDLFADLFGKSDPMCKQDTQPPTV